MRRSLPDCSATTGCTVMCIVTKLRSFANHIFFFLSEKFHDCIFIPFWGAIFSVPECILKNPFDNGIKLFNKLLWKEFCQMVLYILNFMKIANSCHQIIACIPYIFFSFNSRGYHLKMRSLFII